jgi:hypothetical protein
MSATCWTTSRAALGEVVASPRGMQQLRLIDGLQRTQGAISPTQFQMIMRTCAHRVAAWALPAAGARHVIVVRFPCRLMAPGQHEASSAELGPLKAIGAPRHGRQQRPCRDPAAETMQR